MLIGELEKKTELSRHAIRYYEQEGLLGGTVNRTENNYRVYSEETVERIWLIKQAQLAGFTLREVGGLMVSWLAGELTVKEQLDIYRGKIEEIDQKIEDLLVMRDYLSAKIPDLEETKYTK